MDNFRVYGDLNGTKHDFNVQGDTPADCLAQVLTQQFDLVRVSSTVAVDDLEARQFKIPSDVDDLSWAYAAVRDDIEIDHLRFPRWNCCKV